MRPLHFQLDEAIGGHGATVLRADVKKLKGRTIYARVSLKVAKSGRPLSKLWVESFILRHLRKGTTRVKRESYSYGVTEPALIYPTQSWGTEYKEYCRSLYTRGSTCNNGNDYYRRVTLECNQCESTYPDIEHWEEWEEEDEFPYWVLVVIAIAVIAATVTIVLCLCLKNNNSPSSRPPLQPKLVAGQPTMLVAYPVQQGPMILGQPIQQPPQYPGKPGAAQYNPPPPAGPRTGWPP